MPDDITPAVAGDAAQIQQQAPPATSTGDAGQASLGQQATGMTPDAGMTAPGSGVASGSTPPTSLVDLLIQQGLPLQGGDEQAVAAQIRQIYEQAAQLRQLAPYAQTYLQHQREFSEYMRQQAQPAAKKEDPWYAKFGKLPDFDPNWERFIRRDEQGNLTLVPGAPPDILPKYLTGMQDRMALADKFMANPYEFMEGPVKHLASEVARQVLAEEFKRHDERNFASNYVSSNAGWLYQRDQAGNAVRNPLTGEPLLSEEGNRFAGYVNSLQGMGVGNLTDQQSLARYLVSLESEVRQLRGQPPPRQQQTPPPAYREQPLSPREQANQQFTQQFNPPANVPPPPGNAVPPGKRPPRGQRELATRMLQDLAASGFNPGQKID